MARRQRTTVTVSLFPFLSILACVIGTLTLMIMALALGQMDTDTVSDAERYVRLQREVEEHTDRVASLEADLVEQGVSARATRDSLSEVEAELERLTQEKESLLLKMQELAEPGENVGVDEEAHQRTLEEIREEIARLEESIKELEAEAEQKEVEQEVPVLIRPGGSGRGMTPTFVECRAGEIVLLDREPVARISTTDIESSSEFATLLQTIAADENQVVVFLVREDSFSSYTKARNAAQSNYAKNGKLPIVGQGRIDLSLFDIVD